MSKIIEVSEAKKYELNNETKNNNKESKEEHFPKYSNSSIFYRKSYEELKKMTKKNGEFPNFAKWNKYAKENELLSHISLEYITKLKWKYLKIKIEKEITQKIIS